MKELIAHYIYEWIKKNETLTQGIHHAGCRAIRKFKARW
jgi:hypothetical protein